ncbi:MAG: glycosyl hydrolase, partial [Flavobacteriaceae bacterium]
MRKILISVAFLFLILSVSGQYRSDAPWMLELQKKSNKKEFTFVELTNAFDAYWEIHKADMDKKGAGYKPFMRWRSRWEHSVKDNGMVKTPTDIWQEWEAKNKLQARGINDVSDWQSIGPYSQESKSGQGRVNTFIIDPNDPNTYYVGAPAGGIWKSSDAGTTWAPLSDYLPQIGVSGIAIDPNDSNIIYITTGDDDGGDTYSVGVLKSIDGGQTWHTTGLQFNNTYSESNEIYIHPTNSNILWVATSAGLFKTTDAGVTWSNNQSGNVRDLKIHPTNPNILYIVTSSRFYKSTNGGNSFTQITSGLPNSSSRLVIEVTPANANIVYLLSASGGFQGLYKSSNSGTTFVQTSETDDIFDDSDQAFFDMALTVSDTNENIVFVGVLNIWKSTDGGNDFTKINEWFNPAGVSYTHADIHFMRYFNGDLYCGSDGGIYKSTNDGASFNEMNEGLAISQYYRIAVSKQTADNVSGGLQDNGGFGFSNDTWYKYHGGDGMDCAIDPNNPNIYYGFTQYGKHLTRTVNGGVSGQRVFSWTEDYKGEWITPMAINSQSVLYAGYERLYRLDTHNDSWTQVSGDVFGGKLDHVEIDPNNELIIFVARYNKLFKSTFGGLTFSQVYTASGEITSIEVNNEDSNLVYLTTSSSVLKSTNGGTSFTSITGNLPSDSKLIIKHQSHSAINDLYVGTSLGVYHTNDTMNNWEVFSTNLPNVPVRDLEININDRIITAGTYGRGVWQSAITVAPPSDDVRLVSISNPLNVNCLSSLIPQIEVMNEGSNAISQVTINYSIDGVNLSHTYNGTINGQATQLISLPVLNGLTVGEHELIVETTIANDTYSDNNMSNATFFVNQTNNSPTTVNPFENAS